jgi:nicotinate-nucleotide adenylyltransferase
LSEKSHRLRLSQLAFDARKLGAQPSQVMIDDRELVREGASYTVQTLRELAQLYPGAQFYLILGQDQALDFIHWKNHAEILKLCRLAVAKRPGVSEQWHNESLGDFIELLAPLSPISATWIREQIAGAKDASELLDADVIQFIQQQGLYSTKT